MLYLKQWKHVFKLDPDKYLSDEHLERICESGSDAVIIGGTQGITFDNTIELLSRVRRFAIPCLIEISSSEAIVPGFDHYLIPIVLNAGDAEWILKPHHQAIKELGGMIPWNEISTMSYTVLNPDSEVASLTQSDTDLTQEDVIAFGRMGSHLIKSPVFYLEYSGTLGNPDWLQPIYERLKRECETTIFYGGGIRSKETAEQMSRVADVIVVGNIIYEDIEAACQTVIKRGEK